MLASRFRRRAVAALTAAAIGLAATGGPVIAAQSDPGPDTEKLSAATFGETTVFNIDAGSLLQLRLLGEDGLAGINDLDGVTEALTRLVPLEIASSTLPALNDLSIPVMEAHSTSGEDSTSAETPALSDGLPAEVAGLLDGTIAASLLALVDDAGAKGLTDATANVTALAGLISVDDITANLGGTVSPDEADGTRSVAVGQVDALDLTGLLSLLGLDLTDLSLDQITALAGGLGVLDPVLDVLGLDGAGLDALLADLDAVDGDPLAVIDSLQAAIASALAAVDPVVADLCSDLTGGLPLPIPVDCTDLTLVTDLVDELNAQIDALQDLIDSILGLTDGLLGVLDGTPLLAFGGIDAGVFATAARTVEDSLATVDATVGDVFVAGLPAPLPGLDAAASAEQVTALVDQVTGQLDSVLATIGLDGILDIGILEQSTSVTETDGVITALAELTGLRITLTPPDVCALLGGIDPTGTVGSLVDTLGGTLDELPLPVADLLSGLGGVVDCSPVQAIRAMPAQVADVVAGLSQPLTIQAATVSETSTLGVAAPTAPGTPQAPTPVNLPKTGGSTPLLPILAFLVAAGYGIQFLVRRSQT